MSVNIGELLKNARLAKGLEWAEIARDIGVSPQYLEKLEENLFHEIGAPVFVRGYINLYARHLGLPEQNIKEALQNHQFGQTPHLKLNPANIESQAKSYKRNYFGAWLSLFILFLGIVVLAWQVLHRDSWLMKQVQMAFHSPAPENNPQPLDLGLNPSSPKTLVLESTPPAPLALESASGENNPPVANAENNSGSPLALESLDSAEEKTKEETPPVAEIKKSIRLEFSKSAQVTISDKNKKKIAAGTKKTAHIIELNPDDAPFTVLTSRPENIKLTINGEEAQWETYKQKPKTYLLKLEPTNE